MCDSWQVFLLRMTKDSGEEGNDDDFIYENRNNNSLNIVTLGFYHRYFRMCTSFSREKTEYLKHSAREARNLRDDRNPKREIDKQKTIRYSNKKDEPYPNHVHRKCPAIIRNKNSM